MPKKNPRGGGAYKVDGRKAQGILNLCLGHFHSQIP
jgi:hypothetical protein